MPSQSFTVAIVISVAVLECLSHINTDMFYNRLSISVLICYKCDYNRLSISVLICDKCDYNRLSISVLICDKCDYNRLNISVNYITVHKDTLSGSHECPLYTGLTVHYRSMLLWSMCVFVRMLWTLNVIYVEQIWISELAHSDSYIISMGVKIVLSALCSTNTLS
jgi:ribosomal protein L40E